MENKNSIPDEFYFIEYPYYISEIDYSAFPITREVIGNLDFGGSIGLCRIELYHSDGTIPHFHVTDHKDFDICVCIYYPWWFVHFGQLYGRTDITPEFGKKLTDWLKEQSEQIPEFTRWEQICKIWWRVCDKEELTQSGNLEIYNNMPDYSKLDIYPNYDSMPLNSRYISWIYEASIDLSGNIGECDIIHSNTEIGMIPHFHVVSKDRTSFNICVCICSNQYFYHDKNNKVEITNEQKKILDDWLASIDEHDYNEDFGYTNWEAIWVCWLNVYNDQYVRDKNLINLIRNTSSKPNYTIMTELDPEKEIVYDAKSRMCNLCRLD